MRPNTRVQRTRSSPSAHRSPLTRYPLGARRSRPAVARRVLPVIAVLALARGLRAEETSSPAVRVSPNCPAVFVTFAGYGQVGSPLVPRLMIGDPVPGETWMQLHNNTIWSIRFRNYGGFRVSGPDWTAGASLREWMRTRVPYLIEGRDGREIIPTSFRGDVFGEAELASGRSVLFSVSGDDLKNGQRIFIDFRYAWEPDANPYDYESRLVQRVVMTGDMVPTPGHK